MILPLDFRVKKRTRKTKTCDKGYNCGNSCINRKLKCKRKFSDQASTYAGWLKKQGKKASGKKPTKKLDTKLNKVNQELRPLTDEERSQPEKLIEVGKAFAEKYIDLEQIKQQSRDYEAAKDAHREAEVKRTEQVFARKGKLIREINKSDYGSAKAKERGDLEEAKRLTKKANKAQAELKKINDDPTSLKMQRYDKLSDLQAQRASIKFAFKSKLDKETKAAKLKELDAAIKKEQEILPQHKSLARLKEAIKDKSDVSPDQAKQIIKDRVSIAPDYDYSFDTYSGHERVKKHEKRINQDLADIIQITGHTPKDLRLVRKGDRASALYLNDVDGDELDENGFTKLKHRGAEINIGDSYDRGNSEVASETIYHEVAHTIEYINQDIAKANAQWIRDRSTSDTPKTLNELESTTRFDDQEVAFPDDFVSTYVGKDYSFGNRSYEATEVLSVAIEHFASIQRTHRLATEDPEHFYLTIGSILEIQNKNRK